jgi:hypothetical protein
MSGGFEGLITVFEELKEEGFELDKPLKWCWFFEDKGQGKLQNFGKELQGLGFSVDSIVAEEDRFRMCIFKSEILTPETLNENNNLLINMSDIHSIENYDGWDVETA